MMAYNTAKSAGWLIQQVRCEAGDAREAFVWIVMKDYEPAAAVEVEPKSGHLLVDRDDAPDEGGRQ